MIEIDGDTQAHATGRDAQGTAFIAREGCRVIRFTNADGPGSTEGVVRQISFSLREKERGAKRRKGEGDKTKGERADAHSPLPCHAATQRDPRPLSPGERR